MFNIYVDTDKIKDIDDKELIKRYWKISDTLNKAQRTSTNQQMADNIVYLMGIYEEELNRRIDEDLLDEDTLESIWEDIDDRYSDDSNMI